ncbi:function [Dionaea muscipula]
MRREISSKCLLLLAEEVIDRKNESPLISTHLRLSNVREFLYSILFLLLVAGYLVQAHLGLVFGASIELETGFEKVKFWMIPSYMIELRELLDRYPIEDSFCLKKLFLVARNQIGDFLEEIGAFGRRLNAYGIQSIQKKPLNINLIENIIDLISIIPNPISLRHLSHTILHLNDRKRIDQILWNLTHSDHLSKNESGYQMIEQVGAIYLRDLVDIHKKSLINYEFNASDLAERRIFLAQYQTITSLQTSCGAKSFRFPSHGKPFSLRLDLSPPRGILLIGSVGIGRDYWVKYLATNSYVPFIRLFRHEFGNPSYFIIDSVEEEVDVIFEENDDDEEADPREVFPFLQDLQDKCEDLLTRTVLDLDDLDYWKDILDFLSDIYIGEVYMEEERLVDIFLDFICQFELAKVMSPCIIWIPDVQGLFPEAFDYLSLGLLVNFINRDWEGSVDSKRGPTRDILVIASTHIPQRVDPALLDLKKLNTCIKIRRLSIPQQGKHFFTLSYTRGFHLEKQMFRTNGFGPINMGYDPRDLLGLTNEVLSISITQKKSIIDTNTIRFALHRKTWELRSLELGRDESRLHSIAWAPRIWGPLDLLLQMERTNGLARSFRGRQTAYDEEIYEEDEPEEDEPEENDWEFVQFQIQDRYSKEQGFFRRKKFLWYPPDPDPFLFLFDPSVSVFSHRDFCAEDELSEGIMTSQNPTSPRARDSTTPPLQCPTKDWPKWQEKHIEWLLNRKRWLRTNRSLSNGSFRSNTLSESYQYLSNLFLSNERLLDQMTKTLLRKRWLFPDEMKIGFM